MFSCPTDDIHSIYLDSELPKSYLAEYENHLKICKKCSEKIEKFRRLKSIFSNDSKNLSLDKNFIDESYSRLLTKLNYSKNTRFVHQFPVQKAVAGIAAAAAVLVAVVLPVKLIPSSSSSVSGNSANVASIVPVERPQNTSISNKNIVINGNINDNFAQTVSTGALQNPSLADVDVFRPEFQDSNSLRIMIPGFETQTSGMMEVRMPVNTIAGFLP